MGFTQCRKNIDTINHAEGNKVHITLHVDGDNDGSRVLVDTIEQYSSDYAKVTFENEDVIYVAYNKSYVGYLTYNEGEFSGDVTIEQTVDDEPLRFYFLGGKGFEPTISGNTATLDISDQKQKLPVINYGVSRECYPSPTGYSARLLNKCAIVRFNVSKPAGFDQDSTCLMGMNNLVTVSFDYETANTDEGFTYTKVNDGIIKMAPQTGEVWAILLPQEQVSNALAYSTHCATHNWVTVPQIESNDYKPDGITLNLVDNFISASSEKKVLFSQGNLQYLGNSDGTGTWRFAEHQYDYLGDGPSSGTVFQGNVTIEGYSQGKYNNISADKDAARDLFGWGTSGYDNKYPYKTDKNSNQYYNNSISGTNYDWGVYNSANITNGDGKSWRIPTSAEWSNILKREIKDPHDNIKKDRWGFATVNGVKGVVILPDNWTGYLDYDFVYESENYSTNICDAERWAKLESLGCVFLPAASMRNGNEQAMDGAAEGYYWAGTIYTYSSFIRGTNIEFEEDKFVTSTNYIRYYGLSVRLISDVN